MHGNSTNYLVVGIGRKVMGFVTLLNNPGLLEVADTIVVLPYHS